MVVLNTDLKVYKSADGYGGARTDNEIDTTTDDWLDRISGEESSAGDIEYFVIYARNESASEASDVRVHLTANYESDDASDTTAIGDIELGINTAKNTAAPTPSNDSTAPSGVTFSSPANRAAGLVLGDFSENDYRAIFVKRTTDAGADAKNRAVMKFKVTTDSME